MKISRLTNMWNEIFPIEPSLDFSVQQCPMLIGIMRRSVAKKDSSSISEYEFVQLLKGADLMRTKEKFSPTSVLKELSIFREECNDNEQALVSCQQDKKVYLSDIHLVIVM